MPPAASLTLASVGVLLLAVYLTRPVSLLRELSADQFAWSSSTTPIPISAVSVLAKALLSRHLPSLPPALHPLLPASDTLPIQPVRDYANAVRLRRIQRLCKRRACDPEQVDPRFGLTPLHLAAAANDHHLTAWLRIQGATPRADHVGRLPRNLSFANFIPNAKLHAHAAARHDCDFPVVHYDGSLAARRETRRLVSEGEPVLLRGAYAHYARHASWDPPAWVARFAHIPVTVGPVPYADAFNLSTHRMRLGEYYDRFVARTADAPLYVFNKNDDVCRDGYDALARLVADAFPTPHLVAHPDETGGLSGIHFFLGNAGSGAPFHIHADAINAAVSGLKRWFVYTPRQTVYSRKPIKRWVEEELGDMPEEDRPLECVQRKGDVVYVPLDWGHAVLNEESNTFGFALELLNRRDTLSHLWR